jgi:hypothetical protein
MKQIALIFALLSGMAVAQPGPADLIANIPGRTTVSLDGTWNAIVDPYETGLRAKFYENAKAKDKSDLVEYNFDTAGTLKVPCDWNTQRESLMFYENPVWYQRYFSYHKRAKTRVFVYVGAAHYQSREFGGSALYGKHGDEQTRFSEEYQAGLYRHQLASLRKTASLAGMSPWVLMDFRSPRRFLPGVQDCHNRKGLVSDKGQKKQAFYVLQKYYEELK